MGRFLGIDFIPKDVPLDRRLQAILVGSYLNFFLFVGPISIAVLFYVLFFTSYYHYAIFYLIWYLYDHKTHEQGGRPLRFVRHFYLWNYIRDYFPIKLVKTCDLDPQQNYIFGYHPHGFLAIGGVVSFCSSVCGFDRKFPGIVPRFLGLAGWFRLPFTREVALSMGCCSVTKESINHILRKEGPGHSVVLPIGGAAEMLEAHPGVVRLKLKDRKGFIRRAIISGAYLVPVFGFGENEVYNQVSNPEGSILRYLQTIGKKILGFYPVLVYGRGMLQYNFGILPFRKPITVVVGKPIPVEQWPNPGEKDVDRIHELYLTELRKLFDTHKARYDLPRIQMEFT